MFTKIVNKNDYFIFLKAPLEPYLPKWDGLVNPVECGVPFNKSYLMETLCHKKLVAIFSNKGLDNYYNG